MAQIIFDGVASFLQVRTLRLATCWKLTRKDGVKLFFTEHNSKLQIGLGGDIYTPVDGLSVTARQAQSSLKPTNFEARGIVDVAAMSHNDLRSGLYRGCQVIEYVVDWMHAWAGALTETVYWIETTTFNGEFWEAQISSLAHRLKSRVGALYTRHCRYDLGDSLCLVDLDALEETGSTVAVIVNSVLEFQAAMTSDQADDYWSYGLLTWTTGANKGVEIEIDDYTKTSKIIKLRIPTAHKILVGDAFTIVPGCDKTLTQCRVKFDNVINFGGFPHLPGNDKLIEAATGGGGAADKK